jgi:MoaA/NifB/PqqE/SkfB family radical SAM enzyme
VLEKLKKQIGTHNSIASEILLIISEVIKNNLIINIKALKPTVFQININSRCNARCNICNIWKTEDKTEISLEKLEEVFSDHVFQSIEYIILSGGEPTLRSNLLEVVELILLKMPNLRKISIPTTGLWPERSIEYFSAIAKSCQKHRVFLSIGVSLDGVDNMYELTRGITGGYEKVLDTITALNELSSEFEFNIGIGTTISAINVYDVYNLTEVSEKLNVGINFAFAALSESYFNNLNLTENIKYTPESKVFLKRFIKERIEKSPLLSEMSFYYEKALEMMDGAKRTLPCLFQDQGLVLDSTGDLHYCINSQAIGNIYNDSTSIIYSKDKNLKYRQKLIKEICPNCEASCFIGVALRKKMFPFLKYIIKRNYKNSSIYHHYSN